MVVAATKTKKRNQAAAKSLKKEIPKRNRLKAKRKQPRNDHQAKTMPKSQTNRKKANLRRPNQPKAQKRPSQLSSSKTATVIQIRLNVYFAFSHTTKDTDD